MTHGATRAASVFAPGADAREGRDNQHHNQGSGPMNTQSGYSFASRERRA
jgi:hypothetical protein